MGNGASGANAITLGMDDKQKTKFRPGARILIRTDRSGLSPDQRIRGMHTKVSVAVKERETGEEHLVDVHGLTAVEWRVDARGEYAKAVLFAETSRSTSRARSRASPTTPRSC